MSAPLIFLYQEHINDLFQEYRRGSGMLERAALGIALDDGDVFHVYTAIPQTHFAGRPCRATVRFTDRYLDDQPADLLNNEGGSACDARVLILISLERGSVVARGFVRTDRGLVEGTMHFVPVRSEIYSRSNGLLEVSILEQKSVAVVGLGSGGSSIAFSLAQAGVGRLVLVDRDRLEVGNIARHVCGVSDLGRYKTRAMRDVLTGKNPFLQVDTREVDVLENFAALRETIAGVSLLVAATDSDRSRFVLNQVALELEVPALFGRVLTRAVGGDVLRVRPFKGPCLACVYTEQFLQQRQREFSSVGELREDTPAYVPDDDLEAKI